MIFHFEGRRFFHILLCCFIFVIFRKGHLQGEAFIDDYISTQEQVNKESLHNELTHTGIVVLLACAPPNVVVINLCNVQITTKLITMK